MTVAPEVDAAVGRSETVEDVLDPRPARHFQLTLDQDPTLGAGDALPPFWHYLYFNPQIKASDLGPDGHEALGRFIPDFGLPRRMWAGGGVRITAPLRIGDHVRKTSTIRAIKETSGRSGRLCFVTLDHAFTVGGAHRLTETQTIVYRKPPQPGAPPPAGTPAPGDATFGRAVQPDTVLLFRYSALIFYGHKIHYDAPYTRQVEGYPGLLVHGPLTATLLIELGLSQASGRELEDVQIRAMSPLFAQDPFRLKGRHEPDGGITLWARTPEGMTAMTVTLTFRPQQTGDAA